MKYFVKHDSGRILQVMTVQDGTALPTGFIEVQTKPDPFLHYISNGAPVAYTEEESARLRSAPSYPATWDISTKQWVDQRSLADKKTAKKADMKTARNADEFSTFTHDGNTYDCDEVSTQRIMGAVQLAILADMGSQPFSIDWTLADNSVVTLDGAGMIAVGQALAAHVNDKHSKCRTKVTAIDNAPNETALDAITW